MLQIPENLLRSYDTLLAGKSIEEHRRPHYRKWLRFYLDFCHKYQFIAADRGALLHFTEKLRSKNQVEWLCKQAGHAVSLYYEMIEASKGGVGAQPAAQKSPCGANGSSQVPGAYHQHQAKSAAVSSTPIGFRQTGVVAPTPTAPPAVSTDSAPAEQTSKSQSGGDRRRD